MGRCGVFGTWRGGLAVVVMIGIGAGFGAGIGAGPVTATGAAAQEGAARIDVIGWFDGCAKLTQPEAGEIMDVGCVKRALQYCRYGLDAAGKRACIAALGQHFDAANRRIATAVEGFDLNSDWRNRMWRSAHRKLLAGGTQADCPKEVAPVQCRAARLGINWTEWRALERAIDKAEREK
ncbi:hypothetical protein N4R57_13140 [Rhodobacteraceae bacterium D3-12]|nr:hypothetical protein N4R57_13140 [Rhodobacteraceae bacterium D3-12]